jgi:glutamate 5-kinase
VTDILRQEIAASSHTIVVKVGTRVLTRADGTLNHERIAQLAEELHGAMTTDRRIVLVSSGAVGAGMSQMKLSTRPTDLAQLQAVAAVGQTKLIEAYDRTFRQYDRHAGQVLLVAEDLSDRTRYLNVRNTLHALMDLGAIPIINENDTVAVEELMTTFGDNDRLAALVTNLLRAPLLVILSDVEGLYTGSPADPASQRVSQVSELTDTIRSYVIDHKTGLSKGGMASKLEAARMVTAAGENMIIAGGREPGALASILRGEDIGTLFLAQGKSISPRKRWIGFSSQPRGKLIVDAGARRAVEHEGSSLLAIGIVRVEGEFVKGDAVSLVDASGNEFARGLTNYHAAEVRKIAGLPSAKISEVLGHFPYAEVVHRNNLASYARGSDPANMNKS